MPEYRAPSRVAGKTVYAIEVFGISRRGICGFAKGLYRNMGRDTYWHGACITCLHQRFFRVGSGEERFSSKLEAGQEREIARARANENAPMSAEPTAIPAATSPAEPAEPPDTRKAAVWVRSVTLSGILFLMVMYSLYFAASLMIPITMAFLLSLVLSPIVRFMGRLRVPPLLSAALILLTVTGAVIAGLYALATPAADWIQRAPQELRALEYKLAWVKEPIDRINETSEQVDQIIRVDADTDGEDSASATASFSLVGSIMNRTPKLVYGGAVMLILLFFLLSAGDAFLNKMVQVTPTLANKKRVVETARQIQRHVSAYLGTITVINCVLGLVVAVAMFLLKMPNPILWGVTVGVLNYVPYLGVAISVVIIGFVSLLTFDTPAQILLPPLVIIALNVLEGQFITPILAGRRLSLSPVAVFLAIVVLGWIWGIVGVLVAVPMLATLKLVCEQVEPLEHIATFLSRH